MSHKPKRFADDNNDVQAESSQKQSFGRSGDAINTPPMSALGARATIVGSDILLTFDVDSSSQTNNHAKGLSRSARVVMSPTTAERLYVLLTDAIRDHERQFGDPATPPDS